MSVAAHKNKTQKWFDHQWLVRLVSPFLTFREVSRLRTVSMRWNMSVMTSPHWDDARPHIFGRGNILEMDARIEFILKGAPTRPSTPVSFMTLHAVVAHTTCVDALRTLNGSLGEERGCETQFDMAKYLRSLRAPKTSLQPQPKPDDEKKNLYLREFGDGGGGDDGNEGDGGRGGADAVDIATARDKERWISVGAHTLHVSTRPAFFRFFHRCVIQDMLCFFTRSDHTTSFVSWQVWGFIRRMHGLRHPKSASDHWVKNDMDLANLIQELVPISVSSESKRKLDVLGLRLQGERLMYFTHRPSWKRTL
jgi:hypothetical protein